MERRIFLSDKEVELIIEAIRGYCENLDSMEALKQYAAIDDRLELMLEVDGWDREDYTHIPSYTPKPATPKKKENISIRKYVRFGNVRKSAREAVSFIRRLRP